jgi:dynein heavy chain
LVTTTKRVYDAVLNGPLKPTPNKSHYTFNLRDISRINQGLVNANNKLVIQPVHLVRMWVHENKRVFGDRLINSQDREWLDDLLLTEAKGTFNLNKEEIFNSERIIYGDFMAGIELDTRIYAQISDLKLLVTKITDYLEDYNGSVKNPMKLVMFLDACDHVSRLTRIIRAPLGNALSLGVGGSGRQSLSRLATFLANYKLSQIEVVKGYSMQNWRDDVKKALMQAGVENKPTTFLFVDTQIINEQMLEDINGILNSGDVPNLYKVEDMENIAPVGQAECIAKNI